MLWPPPKSHFQRPIWNTKNLQRIGIENDPPSMKNSKKYPYWCAKLSLRYQPKPAQCEVLCSSIHCAVVLHSDGFLEHCGCLERAVKKTIKAESRTSALREGDKVYIRSHRRNDPLQMVPARFCPIEEIKFRHFDWRTKKRYQGWAPKEIRIGELKLGFKAYMVAE